MNKAIFLDRDGTINIDKHYLYRVEDFEFLPGTISALRTLLYKGYLLIIITNQSGIARGYFTEKEYRQLNKWMLDELEEKGVHITATYHCPHLPDAVIPEYKKDCNCRKPKLALFEQAVKEHKIDLASSYAVGDKIRDCSICIYTLCRGFLIGQNEQASIIDKVKMGSYSRISYCSDLLEMSMRIP